jgi:hypothetical protein
MSNDLRTWIQTLEQDRSLDEPLNLRQRLDVLDLLEAHLPDAFDTGDSGTDIPSTPHAEPELHRRAQSLRSRLESANLDLYQTIRHQIQSGSTPSTLLRQISSQPSETTNPEHYDYLDDLIAGVLHFDTLNTTDTPDTPTPLTPEMVAYQPTPARHIFDLIARTPITPADTLVDLGSGLGHVPLLVSICTGIRTIGIELDPACINPARRSAQSLHLDNVTFLQQDAREADLSTATIFYLYTPFTGAILRTVLDALRREASTRKIRVCTLGPCTPLIASEPWLHAIGPTQSGRIAIFHSRS